MWLAVLFLSFLSLAQGQTIVPLPDNIKNDIMSRVDSGANPSIAIAAYEDGEIDFYVYGLMNVSAGTVALKTLSMTLVPFPRLSPLF